jgi:hypothetical protein
MGRMKDLHITVYNGGEGAVAAVERMGKDWRAQLEQAASEIEGMRLTDAEREAVMLAETTLRDDINGPCNEAAATLRGLLDRLA